MGRVSEYRDIIKIKDSGACHTKGRLSQSYFILHHLKNQGGRLMAYLCAIVVNRSSFTALRTSARWRSVEML